MCRFIAYLGEPFVLHDVLYKPVNSLIKQSVHAKEMEEPLNGDGFGISWYLPQIDNLPGVFKSIQPAWNDLNLETLSAKIFSGSFLAHVRAASQGDVNRFNTHPFTYKEYSFMHNGGIGGFGKIRRTIFRDLSDELFNWVKGQTDSELFFAIFLEFMHQSNQTFDIQHGAHLLRKTLDYIETLQKNAGIIETNYINIVISDGKSLLTLRYVSNEKENASSLYYALGEKLEYQNGYCHMHSQENHHNESVLISSEKFTSHKMDWIPVPTNHILLVNEHRELDIQAV